MLSALILWLLDSLRALPVGVARVCSLRLFNRLGNGIRDMHRVPDAQFVLKKSDEISDRLRGFW